MRLASPIVPKDGSAAKAAATAAVVSMSLRIIVAPYS
jgi:hypothetical protein